MEIMKDCLPCLLRQAEEAAKRVNADPHTKEKIIGGAKEILSRFEEYENAPALAEAIHNCVKNHTGNTDPYKAQKTADLEAANSLIPTLKAFIDNSGNRLYASLKVSAVGNNLDSAVYGNMDIKSCIDKELNAPFAICDEELLREKLTSAKSVLVIGDNAGETVFDKVFIESLPHNISFTYAVRSAPIINDATLLEAQIAELNKIATVIPSGSTAPGSILQNTSKEFKEALGSSDIVISKGQGNFESLSEVKGIFFLLKAKCPVIARRFKTDTGSYIFKYNA